VHPDPRLDPFFHRELGIRGSLIHLDSMSAAHRVHDAIELSEHRIPGRIDHPPIVRFDGGSHPIVKLADTAGRSLLVGAHHPAEAGNVRHENGGQLPALSRSLIRHERAPRAGR
jgi:hypothetical protein